MFVSDIVKGGAVETDGRLMQGDQILSVNGEDVRSATQEYVAALLKVNVRVARLNHCLLQLIVIERYSNIHTYQIYTILPKVLAPLLMKGLTTLVISMSTNLNV